MVGLVLLCNAIETSSYNVPNEDVRSALMCKTLCAMVPDVAPLKKVPMAKEKKIWK